MCCKRCCFFCFNHRSSTPAVNSCPRQMILCSDLNVLGVQKVAALLVLFLFIFINAKFLPDSLERPCECLNRVQQFVSKATVTAIYRHCLGYINPRRRFLSCNFHFKINKCAISWKRDGAGCWLIPPHL